ncbi:MAG: hypothetical protein Q8R08_04295 [bacterium]|nr:hypothetical protein [bacterium]
MEDQQSTFHRHILWTPKVYVSLSVIFFGCTFIWLPFAISSIFTGGGTGGFDFVIPNTLVYFLVWMVVAPIFLILISLIVLTRDFLDKFIDTNQKIPLEQTVKQLVRWGLALVVIDILGVMFYGILIYRKIVFSEMLFPLPFFFIILWIGIGVYYHRQVKKFGNINPPKL